MNNVKGQLIEFHKILSEYTNENIDTSFVNYLNSLKQKEIESAVETSKKINEDFLKLVSDNNDGSKRRTRKRKRTKKRGGAGYAMVAVGLGAFITYIVYTMFFKKYDRYRGRVPVEYQDERPYAVSDTLAVTTRYPNHPDPEFTSNPHYGLYPGEYHPSNVLYLNEANNPYSRRRRELMQMGVDGFQSAVNPAIRRRPLTRPSFRSFTHTVGTPE